MINTVQVMVLNSIVAFAGDYLISASFDKTLRIWSLKVISALTHFSSSPTGFFLMWFVYGWYLVFFFWSWSLPPPGFAQVFNGKGYECTHCHITFQFVAMEISLQFHPYISVLK